MFEKIVLRRSDNGLGLSLGDVAEAMLFYQSVHVILDMQSLDSLVKQLGARPLLSLLARRRLSAIYTEDALITSTKDARPFKHHSFGAFTISSKANQKILKTPKARLAMSLERYGHSPREAKDLAGQFLEHIHIRGYASDFFTPGGIPRAATAELSDAGYVVAAIGRILETLPGFEGMAEKLKAEVVQRDDGSLVFLHNIDFNVANARRKKENPTLEAMTEAHLLVVLLDASADVKIASHYGGDFRTSVVDSDLVRLRYSGILRRTDISDRELAEFRDVVLTNYPSVKEVIDSGERTFDDFERLLDKSDKFRSTVASMSPDASLVAEYLAEVSKEGWITSIPAKTVRYVICALIALKSDAAGFAAAWADQFLTERLLKGWRPNHFVDGKLKRFLDP